MTPGGPSAVGPDAVGNAVPAAAQLITAAESEQAQRRAAAGLARLGLRSGDRIAIVARSSSAYLAVALGSLRR